MRWQSEGSKQQDPRGPGKAKFHKYCENHVLYHHLLDELFDPFDFRFIHQGRFSLIQIRRKLGTVLFWYGLNQFLDFILVHSAPDALLIKRGHYAKNALRQGIMIVSLCLRTTSVVLQFIGRLLYICMLSGGAAPIQIIESVTSEAKLFKHALGGLPNMKIRPDRVTNAFFL
jgi:hypothetical protein